MVIWLFNPNGPIPGESWREYCFTSMGKALCAAGHEVIWWTSSFSHHFKSFRSDDWSDIEVGERFRIRLVPTSGYGRNIGVGRVWRDVVFGLRAWRRGKSEAAPDCIVSSESPLTFGFAGPALARFHGCPIVHHQMDLWPELLVKAPPRSLQRLADLLFWPVYHTRKRVYARLAAATGLTRPCLEGVLAQNENLRARPHAVIYNGIDVNTFRASMDAAPAWANDLPKREQGHIWAVFVGSLGPSYDVPTLCEAAQLLEKSNVPIHILIAGDGPYRKGLENAASACSRLHYLGKVPPPLLASLYRQCDVGLCAYSGRSNVEMPDELYDYMAAGLPVLNSLQGEIRELIRDRQMGLQYRAGDATDLVWKLRTLTAGTRRMRRFAANSFRAGAEFDQRVQYAKMVEIVNRVASRSPDERSLSYAREAMR